MVEIYGKHYYIDLDAVTDRCRIESIRKHEDEDEDEDEDGDNSSGSLNIFKYEIIKMCLERVLGEYDEQDDDSDIFGAKKASQSFKIAFNTLIKYEILIEELNEDDE
jgi:hypothetical protein